MRRLLALTALLAACSAKNATDDTATGDDVTADEQVAEPAEDTQTLTEHLGELRTRIIRSALAVLIGMVVIIALYDQVLEFLKQPYVDLCTSKAEDFCDQKLAQFEIVLDRTMRTVQAGRSRLTTVSLVDDDPPASAREGTDVEAGFFDQDQG